MVLKLIFVKLSESFIGRVFFFYLNGFREMTLGRTLWVIILVKLFIMFAILRVFFFPDFLKSKGSSQKEKADYVRKEIIERKNS